MKKNKKTLAREATLKILYEQEFHKEKQLNKETMDSSSKAIQNYVNHLLEGIKNHRKKIDDLIQQTSQYWKIKRISLIDLNIMRIAVYEMLYSTPCTPFKVCIDEAVEMAKIYGTADSPKFINGNLDTISKKLKV